jgi:hypothetical protein
VTIRRDGPLPTQLGSIRRGSGPFLDAVGRLVRGAVERNVAEIEADDPVERCSASTR